MASKKKPTIHLFANEQFPRRLWIVRDVSYSWVKERFRGIDGSDITEYSKNEAKAVTYPEIEHIESHEYGILIYILDNKMSVSDCSHEAGHFVLTLYKAIGEEVNLDNQEVFCYLLGYATDCLYQVVKNRFRPMLDGSQELQ